jgi:succinyl-diaminopimelate desuccinylase
VECGPVGDGHHGPEEWVSVRSLDEYRKALVEFVTLLPARLEDGRDDRRLRIA